MTSALGGAVAYDFVRTDAFAIASVEFRRYAQGVWTPSHPLPNEIDVDPLRFKGAMTPGGSVCFAWASAQRLSEVATLQSRTLNADGTWSEATTVGDSGVGWWQEPTLPVPIVASNDELSIVAWSRIDQDADGWPATVWSTARPSGREWASAGAVESVPESRTSPAVVLGRDGTAWVVWIARDRIDGTVKLEVARWRADGWDPPQVIDQALSDVGFGLSSFGAGGTDLATGRLTLVYERTDAAGAALLATTSGDGSTWSRPEAVATFGAGLAFRVVGNGSGDLLVSWADGSGQFPLSLVSYSPTRGWSSPAILAGTGGGDAFTAVGSEGRAAVAYALLPSAARTDPPAGLFVRRYLPATGWGDPELIEAGSTTVIGLGYAGSELVLTWSRATLATYARILR